ncbi:MAG: hypothetical protein ACR2QM_10305 [Longimicrobiales bacterium]
MSLALCRDGFWVASLVLLLACQPGERAPAQAEGSAADRAPKNEVVVLGMIHGEHRTSAVYGTDVLRELIREIGPDVVLTEIPPDRFDAAVAGFQADDSISEPRVIRFPEYVDVLFPLTKEMDFEIVPTAGWTLALSDYRAERLASIPNEPEWAERWQTYEVAIQESQAALEAGGAADDPRWINTDAYDAAQEIRLSVYNELFNEELREGGWENINRAHYALIERALDERSGVGLRVLVTYGAGHKGWFLRALRQRDDIELLDVAPFLDAIGR